MKSTPLSRSAARRAWLRGALLLSLAGCAAESPLPSACDEGAACPSPSSLLSWAGQLTPSTPQAGSTGQNLAPQEVIPLTFSSDGLSVLRLRSAAVLRGEVQDAAGLPVARARLTVTLPSGISGQSPIAVTATSDANGAFSLSVPTAQDPRSQPHQLWLSFDDPAQAARRPPLARSLVISNSMDLQLRLQPEATLSTVRGRVLDQTGKGLAGLRVQVVTAAGDILSSTAQSSDGMADALGSYRVLFDPQLTAEERLFLVAQPGQPGQGPILLQLLQRPSKPEDLQVDLQQPVLQTPQAYKLLVQGNGPSGVQLHVAGARVQALTQIGVLGAGLTSALYVTSGETDRDGVVALRLLPAPPASGTLAYQLTVTSPVDSPLSSAVLVRQVGPLPELSLAPVQLLPRPQVRGRIVAVDGAPVAGAQVVAKAIFRSPPVSMPPSRPTLSAAPDSPLPQTPTDAEGRFSLRLDPGDYDLDIVPEPGTAPRYSLDNQRVQSDLDAGNIRLPRPTLGQVKVLGPEGYPVLRVNLRIFQLPSSQPGTQCVQGKPCSQAARLRAELSTDSKGMAKFLLPDVP